MGTSTDKEAKEAFIDFEKNIISYVWNNVQIIDETDSELEVKTEDLDDSEISEDSEDGISDSCTKSINLAFAKSQSHQRKVWLQSYDRENIIENNIKRVPIYDFINKDLIHFSNYDNIRSIPSIDGFKPSQRKIIYGSFLKNLIKQEVKVTQLAGWVSDKSEYHHGEASLQGAIINMAQDYVGSNNLNLLTPNGNFGTRRTGGKDASSPRYIFTQFNKLVPFIFRKEDNHILNYIDEEGVTVEPEVYAPIIPMVLINGCEGIGTGFSTKIPCFNPLDIIKNISNLLEGKDLKEMFPWYSGFTGRIIKLDDNTYQSIGKYTHVNSNTIHVSELPVGTWTQNYKDELESLIVDDTGKPTARKFLTGYINHSGNTNVDFTIKFAPTVLQKLIKNNEIEKKLKLQKTIKITNMHLYNETGTIIKFNDINEILQSYYIFRLKMYELRKEYYMRYLQLQMDIAKYRVMFIEYIFKKKIVLQNKKRDDVIKKLEHYKFPRLATNVNAEDKLKSYEYLTEMSLFTLTFEKIEELKVKIQLFKNYGKENLIFLLLNIKNGLKLKKR